MSGRLLKSFSKVWPEGFSSLLEDLNRQGFEAAPRGLLDSDLVRSLEFFHTLKRPRSLQLSEKAHVSDFSFVSASGKISVGQGWGLLLVDSKNKNLLEKCSDIRVLQVNCADAAMDFICSKIIEADWSGDSASIPPHIKAEAGVVLGPDCVLGEGCILEAGVRLGARVRIGKGTRVCANTRIADDTQIGGDCSIGPSVSLGGPGFGFVKYPHESSRRPRIHCGAVKIGNGVRLGASVCVDRGVFETTEIGDFSALDNLVQIGHNSVVGKNAILCSLVGLSGSTILGDRVTIAGLSGTKDGVHIGSDVTIAAQSGVSRNIENGEIVKGYPPRPLKESLEIQTLVGRLPDFFKRLKKLEKTSTGE